MNRTDEVYVITSYSIHYTKLYDVAVDLGVGLNFISPIHIYYPKREQTGRPMLQNAFNHDYLFPSGVFSVQQEIDAQYVLVPIDFAREIFELDGRVTSLELKLKPDVEVEDIQDKVKALLGDAYKVRDRYEQHEFLYRVMESDVITSYSIHYTKLYEVWY